MDYLHHVERMRNYGERHGLRSVYPCAYGGHSLGRPDIIDTCDSEYTREYVFQCRNCSFAITIRTYIETAEEPVKEFKVGDRVVRNPATWEPNEFDSWGRGSGIGVVVQSPLPLEPGEVDIRWPAGRCFESARQLLPAVKTAGPVTTPGPPAPPPS